MSSLNIATVSDIHLGNRRNPTARIVKNLYDAIPDNATTAALDIIFLAGDIFDDLLNMSQEEIVDIQIWASKLIAICAKYKIILRILKGTPSHDWEQSQLFVTLEAMLQTGVDMQYIRELSIEYIQPLDIHVLYVPDEWEPDTATTLSQVHALLRAKGLAQVDYAVMHGQFEFQLPPFIKASKHDSLAYLAIVKHLIFIGHIHSFSRYDRICAQGSFDRLLHGEEEPKGHVRAVVHDDGNYQITFIENKNAKRFDTINCVGLPLEATLTKIRTAAADLPDGSAVRVEADLDNPIFSNMEILIRQFPFITWSKLVRGEEDTPERQLEDSEVIDWVPITYTSENLGVLLYQRVVALGASPAVLDATDRILSEVL